MAQKSFLRTLFNGFVSMGKGMASLSLVPSYHLPNYEEQFGTDEELLASDWEKVGDDMRHAIQQFELKENKK